MAGGNLAKYSIRAVWNNPFALAIGFSYVGSFVFGAPMSWERWYKINRFIGRDLAR
jgi:hypothetical protein